MVGDEQGRTGCAVAEFSAESSAGFRQIKKTLRMLPRLQLKQKNSPLEPGLSPFLGKKEKGELVRCEYFLVFFAPL